VTPELETLLRHLEPCGIGNPAPVLVARQARLASPPRVVGREHLKLQIDRPAGALTALGWGMASRAGELDVSRPFDVAFRLERDDWNGESRLQARLMDFRA
jgi:single-stranded-DNA-specific exonuclease